MSGPGDETPLLTEFAGGLIAVLGVGVCLVCCLFCRLREEEEEEEEEEEPAEEMQSLTQDIGYDKLKQVAMDAVRGLGLVAAPDSLQGGKAATLITNDEGSELQYGRKLGKGTYGVVFAGQWRGMQVAIKQLIMPEHCEAEELDQLIFDFRSEVSITATLRHPNIVQFLGFTTSPRVTIIQELCPDGSLYDLLRDRAQYTMSQLVVMCLDVAKGMQYLHSRAPPLMHRDLKSPNLLVVIQTHESPGDTLRLKITDFGLARSKARSRGDGKTMVMTQCGTPFWTAPEVLSGKKYNESADVYSFGLCVYEIFSRRLPFDGAAPMEVTMKVVSDGLRPPLPKEAPKSARELMQRCWAQSPKHRPTFVQIVDFLTRFAGANNLLMPTREMDQAMLPTLAQATLRAPRGEAEGGDGEEADEHTSLV